MHVQRLEGVHLLLSPKLGTGLRCALKKGVHLGRVHLGRFDCISIRIGQITGQPKIHWSNWSGQIGQMV